MSFLCSQAGNLRLRAVSFKNYENREFAIEIFQREISKRNRPMRWRIIKNESYTCGFVICSAERSALHSGLPWRTILLPVGEHLLHSVFRIDGLLSDSECGVLRGWQPLLPRRIHMQWGRLLHEGRLHDVRRDDDLQQLRPDILSERASDWGL